MKFFILIVSSFCLIFYGNSNSKIDKNEKDNKVNIITLEVSAPDILLALSDYNENELFRQAIKNAKKSNSNDFLDTFRKEFEKKDPNVKLAVFFQSNKNIKLSFDNKQVIDVLKREIEKAITNSFNVLVSRIDGLGTAKREVGTSKILIKLHKDADPEYVRKILQGSAVSK